LNRRETAVAAHKSRGDANAKHSCNISVGNANELVSGRWCSNVDALPISDAPNDDYTQMEEVRRSQLPAVVEMMKYNNNLCVHNILSEKSTAHD
jgi:hypothetical protein